MHDAPPPSEPDATAGEHLPERQGGLTAESIDRILADFRTHLESLTALPEPEPEPPAVELAALVGQFTALRHDVNLQTKATRAATDLLATAAKPDPAEAVKPLLKVLVDVADALAQAQKHILRTKEALQPLVARLSAEPVDVPTPGFLARLFGAVDVKSVLAERQSTTADAQAKLDPLLAGLADGYAMSLRRIEKALPAFGLEPIPCLGRPFDPEAMEAVEAVGDTGRTSGEVVDVLRQGYRLNGQLFHFAQVKVAR